MIQQFKPRPPKIEALQFVGDYSNACAVIEDLKKLDIKATYSPELEDGSDEHILLIKSNGEQYQLWAGSWIVWDPTPKMLDMKYMNYRQGWVLMSNDEFHRRYLPRTDADG